MIAAYGVVVGAGAADADDGAPYVYVTLIPYEQHKIDLGVIP